MHYNIKQNLSKSEYRTIKSLQNDESIIIKEADKGKTTVIMDKERYREMVELVINDKNYDEKLPGDPQRDTGQKYNNFLFLKKHQDLLTEKGLDYLQNFGVKSSQFYSLPKIHKSKTISERCKRANLSYVEVKDVNDLKLRPIVAGPSCLLTDLVI